MVSGAEQIERMAMRGEPLPDDLSSPDQLLYLSYGFGRGRLEHVLRTISSLSAEHERDEVYWAHIDRVVIDGLGVKFEREAEE